MRDPGKKKSVGQGPSFRGIQTFGDPLGEGALGQFWETRWECMLGGCPGDPQVLGFE